MLRYPLQELFKQYGKWLKMTREIPWRRPIASVAGKQPWPQWLEMDAAIKHCTAGIGIWKWGNQQ